MTHTIQDENWRLFTNFPTSSDGKRNTSLGAKVSSNIMYSIDNNTFKKTLPDLWHKIDTLNEISNPQVDWDALKAATKKAPSKQLIWAVRLSTKEPPTRKVMETRGPWPTP